jgi:hypothetical protein
MIRCKCAATKSKIAWSQNQLLSPFAHRFPFAAVRCNGQVIAAGAQTERRSVPVAAASLLRELSPRRFSPNHQFVHGPQWQLWVYRRLLPGIVLTIIIRRARRKGDNRNEHWAAWCNVG